MDSIIQSAKECYFTYSTMNLESHHIFGGANRKLSEKYGLKVWLTHDEHTGDNGVHFNNNKALWLKQMAQRRAMEYYGWSKDEFIKIFGRNYL